MSTNVRDNIIPIEQIKKSPRGRPKQLIEGLSDTLKDLKPGYAVLLGQTFGTVPMNDRNRISTVIRKHWKLVRDDRPSIHYTPEGIPQVSVKAE